jgi:hypothetical protein
MADKPPKVYYPRKSGEPKELTPSSKAEFEALLRMGWTTEKPQGAQ